MVECVDSAGQWVQSNLNSEARSAWFNAPWIVRVLVSRDGPIIDRVPNKNEILVRRVKEAADFMVWNTAHMSERRLLQLNKVWRSVEALWSSVEPLWSSLS